MFALIINFCYSFLYRFIKWFTHFRVKPWHWMRRLNEKFDVLQHTVKMNLERFEFDFTFKLERNWKLEKFQCKITNTTRWAECARINISVTTCHKSLEKVNTENRIFYKFFFHLKTFAFHSHITTHKSQMTSDKVNFNFMKHIKLLLIQVDTWQIKSTTTSFTSIISSQLSNQMK